MKTKKPSRMTKPPRNYQGYFELTQTISGRVQESGNIIGKLGIHAPVFHRHIVEELQCLQQYCGRAIEALNTAQADWEAEQ